MSKSKLNRNFEEKIFQNVSIFYIFSEVVVHHCPSLVSSFQTSTPLTRDFPAILANRKYFRKYNFHQKSKNVITSNDDKNVNDINAYPVERDSCAF